MSKSRTHRVPVDVARPRSEASTVARSFEMTAWQPVPFQVPRLNPTTAVSSGVTVRSTAVTSPPAAEVMDAALKMAEELNALPPLAVRWTKLAVNKWIKHQLNLILDASIAYEMLSINSRDHHEAAQAFIEKRKPVFKGI